jgi:hypothetical protein
VPAATLLGVTMVVAIIASGIGRGDVIPNASHTRAAHRLSTS